LVDANFPNQSKAHALVNSKHGFVAFGVVCSNEFDLWLGIADELCHSGLDRFCDAITA
jgi:hypothetical protein